MTDARKVGTRNSTSPEVRLWQDLVHLRRLRYAGFYKHIVLCDEPIDALHLTGVHVLPDVEKLAEVLDHGHNQVTQRSAAPRHEQVHKHVPHC
jgi:ferric-dicitrate binding protein FerR (iron transport regulator)